MCNRAAPATNWWRMRSHFPGQERLVRWVWPQPARALYRLAGLLPEAVAVAWRNHLRLTMHLAESDEEMEMFCQGRGRLFDLLQGVRAERMEDCQQNKTPLALMLDRETLDDRWIVVHLNELTGERFRPACTEPSFSHCALPTKRSLFPAPPFALRRLLEMGFNICLGTDSLASNSSLSLFAEMRTLRQGVSLAGTGTDPSHGDSQRRAGAWRREFHRQNQRGLLR